MRNGDLSNVCSENIIIDLDDVVQLKDISLITKVMNALHLKHTDKSIKDVDLTKITFIHKLIRKTDFSVTVVTTNKNLYNIFLNNCMLPCGIVYIQERTELLELFRVKFVTFFLTDDTEYLTKGISQAITFNEFYSISGVK